MKHYLLFFIYLLSFHSSALTMYGAARDALRMTDPEFMRLRYELLKQQEQLNQMRELHEMSEEDTAAHRVRAQELQRALEENAARLAELEKVAAESAAALEAERAAHEETTRARAASTERHAAEITGKEEELEAERFARKTSHDRHTAAIEAERRARSDSHDRHIAAEAASADALAKSEADRLQAERENEYNLRALRHIQNPRYNPFFSVPEEFPITYPNSWFPDDDTIPKIPGIGICNKQSKRDLSKDGTPVLITRYIIQPNREHQTNIDTKAIILKIVHGTFSSDRAYSDSPTTRNAILIFAQQLALAYQTNVHVDFFKWSGALDNHDRMNIAGVNLALNIKNSIEPIKHKDYIVWVIAHSHGCNVTHNAAQHLKKPEFHVEDKRISIDNAVLCASPVLDIDPASTESLDYNIHSLLHFYGYADTTARVGSWAERLSRAVSAKSLLRKEHSVHENEYVRNIRVKMHEYDTNHLNIVDVVVRYLADIYSTIGHLFPLQYDLIINIAPFHGSFRPEFAIAKTDRALTILSESSQYLRFLSPTYLDLLSKAQDEHEQTVERFKKRYTKTSTSSMFGTKTITPGNIFAKDPYPYIGDRHVIPDLLKMLYGNFALPSKKSDAKGEGSEVEEDEESGEVGEGVAAAGGGGSK